MDTVAYGMAALGQVASHALQPDERLINAVDFLRRTQPRCQAHHAIAHVAIQREIRAQGHQAVRFFHVPDLEPRCPHLDPQGFCLIAAGNGAAIVISE